MFLLAVTFFKLFLHSPLFDFVQPKPTRGFTGRYGSGFAIDGNGLNNFMLFLRLFLSARLHSFLGGEAAGVLSIFFTGGIRSFFFFFEGLVRTLPVIADNLVQALFAVDIIGFNLGCQSYE